MAEKVLRSELSERSPAAVDDTHCRGPGEKLRAAVARHQACAQKHECSRTEKRRVRLGRMTWPSAPR